MEKFQKTVAIVIVAGIVLATVFAVGYRIGYDVMERAIQQTEKVK